ncbi:2'-5' RNA ligase family protein [Paracoccus fontiphilus]|uniref:2'-5' RNA ligase family protein n=1 Tax=Paracoccus fontiphilus TaxID=1815556 RepID=A0ABV7IKI9_9RHOB|nr:2'-5' RNA ligase family protein [Paracoccus fontiphilus]
MTDDAPLILTLRMDDASFALFQAMRQRHFPAARNHIPAHLTLFHHLPGARIGWITQELSRVAEATASLMGRVAGLRFLGRGVAYDLDCPGIERLRAVLSGIFADVLTAQDRQRIRPHVTIQNKVAPAEARRLFDDLSARFQPLAFEATGFLLWRYRGGPWDAAGWFPFGGSAGGMGLA